MFPYLLAFSGSPLVMCRQYSRSLGQAGVLSRYSVWVMLSDLLLYETVFVWIEERSYAIIFGNNMSLSLTFRDPNNDYR